MKYWYLYIIGILCVALFSTTKRLNVVNKQWLTAEENVKSYVSLFDGNKKQNAALQLTVDQLNYFKDSILVELNATRKELNVKDKNLKSLQLVSSSFSKSDTIVLKDTLFKEMSLSMDTILSDKWYKVKLGLHYPSMIVVQPEFSSEKHIVVSTKKETVSPPKRFFIFRWFQKKHFILNVDVVEKNPYVQEENSRYVEVIK